MSIDNQFPPASAPQPTLQASQTPPAASQPLSPADERTWALLAHLSVLLNLVTGFAGPIAALIIYLVYKERSRYVAYHALQSMIFQSICWYGGGMLAGICGILAGVFAWTIVLPILFGLVALTLALLPMGAIVYGIIAAVQVNQGQDFKYWLVGDWVRGTLLGK